MPLAAEFAVGDFREDFFEEDDAAGRLADGVVEASATVAGALEAELVESAATDGAGASAASFLAAEASVLTAVSEELLE